MPARPFGSSCLARELDATPTPTLVKYRVAGRVLVMDDESSVLRLVQRALQDAGYATKAATNGGGP